jgi:formiminotetrahydrofolate cyclodeaminase
MSLAEVDAAAYRDVLAVQRDRDAPDRAQRLRQALADAADPLVQIVETAQAVTELAEAAVRDARGGVRGEALTAIVLAAGVVRAGVPLVELNLTGHPDDPRRGLVRASSVAAEAALERMVGPPPGAA